MKTLSIAFLSTSFVTALLSALSIIILFVPFNDRTVEVNVTPTSSSDPFGFYTYPTYQTGDYSYSTPTQTYSYSQTPYSTITTTEYLADETDTYLTTATYTYLQYARSVPTQTLPRAAHQARATNLPNLKRQNPTVSSTSSSASPVPSQTQISVPQSRVGGILVIILLVICAILLVESLALGIYFAVKKKRLSKQRAFDVNEGVAVPLAQSTPAATPAAEIPTPGVERERNPEEVKVVVSFARCHFSCLLVLAILLLIPLALLLYTVSVFNAAGDLFSGIFVNRIGYYDTSYSSSICYGNSGYECNLTNPDDYRNFNYFAGPILAILILGWLLFASTILLAVLVCIHRGVRRRKTRGSRNSSIGSQTGRDGNINHDSNNGLEMAQAHHSAALYSDSRVPSSQNQPSRPNDNPFFDQNASSGPQLEQMAEAR